MHGGVGLSKYLSESDITRGCQHEIRCHLVSEFCTTYSFELRFMDYLNCVRSTVELFALSKVVSQVSSFALVYVKFNFHTITFFFSCNYYFGTCHHTSQGFCKVFLLQQRCLQYFLMALFSDKKYFRDLLQIRLLILSELK